MTSNLKPVIYTMIFFIIVFPWIWMVYIPRLDFHYVSLPGIQKWDMLQPLNICPFGFSNWIIVYILVSFPIGFLLQNGLKYITFTRRIKRTEHDQERKIEETIINLEKRISEKQKQNITINKSNELIAQARQKINEKKFVSASNLLTEAEDYIDHKTQTHERVTKLLTQTETMIEHAKNKGVNTESAEKSLSFSKKALKRNDDTSAIYYAKQSQHNVKESRQQHKDAEETLSSIKALMYDLRDINTEEADKIFVLAETAMKEKNYAAVIKHSKVTKLKAEEIGKTYQEAVSVVNSAKSAIENIKHLDLDVPQAERLFNSANDALKNLKYEKAIEIGRQCNELITNEREKFQEAQESVSFAKLVISNALSFGAIVNEAESLVADAELALSQKNYQKSIKLANKAKDIAESAKRQQQRLNKRK